MKNKTRSRFKLSSNRQVIEMIQNLNIDILILEWTIMYIIRWQIKLKNVHTNGRNILSNASEYMEFC